MYNIFYLELLRRGNIVNVGKVNDLEVDFVVKGARRSAAIECKYKCFEKPVSSASLNRFSIQENITSRYIANINSNISYAGTSFIPGIVADRIL